MHRRQTILGLLAVGPAISSGTGAAMLNTTADKVQRLAERYAAAWNASDMDAMAVPSPEVLPPASLQNGHEGAGACASTPAGGRWSATASCSGR